jgi:hypothetical protein
VMSEVFFHLLVLKKIGGAKWLILLAYYFIIHFPWRKTMSQAYNAYTEEDFTTYEDKDERDLLDNNLEDYLSYLNESEQAELKKLLKVETFRFEFMTFTRLTATLMYLSVIKFAAPNNSIEDTFQKTYLRITQGWSQLNSLTQKMIHFYLLNDDVEESIVHEMTDSHKIKADVVRARLEGLREGLVEKINL